MPMITSPQNSKIKLVRSLQSQAKNRKSESAFVAEGVRLVEEALAENWPVELILYDETLSDRGRELLVQLKKIPGAEVAEVPPDLMAQISDTETPQGILAVLRQKFLPLPDSPTFIVLADQIRDPGNMGTLLRTAEAFNVEAVVLTPGTVDAHSPKVVRAGMGAHFRLPIHPLPWHEIHTFVAELPVYLAEADEGIPLWEADLARPCALLVGGEAFGASPMGEDTATQRITIPTPGRAESLNAAIAAGILMAEVLRQRYHPKD